MTDDELAMAYADGELDPIAAHRFERRMADEEGLRSAVANHRALRARVRIGFDPIVDTPLPERLTGLLHSDVVAFAPRNRPAGGWRAAAAMAACLLIGVAIGHASWQSPSGVSGERLMASGALARVLDGDLAGGAGPIRVLVSFRETQGGYCRVFAAPAIDGIACRQADGWILRRTRAGKQASPAAYRQAESSDPELLTEAQHMMNGDPLGLDGEEAARSHGWR